MSTSSKANVVIIGAGPAGLAAAHSISKAGLKPQVFEAAPHVGGMARSFELFEQRVDCGPHRFFTKQPEVSAFFDELIGQDYVEVQRLTRIYYDGKFYDYPLKASSVWSNLAPDQIGSILYSYLLKKLSPIKNPQNLEDWISNKFGNELYQLFFKNYSEKLWGIPCSQIDADWAAQRIKSLSLFEAVKNNVRGNRGKHHSFVDKFRYPVNGTGMLYERAQSIIEQLGGKINLRQAVKRLVFSGKKVSGIELADGSEILADHVISTMPLTLLLKGLPSLPEEVAHASDKLYFRHTILVYLEIDSTDLFEDNWLYIHSPEVRHGRVTNFRNWSPGLYQDKSTSILCVEFWAFDKDPIWHEKDEYLQKLAEKELRQIELIPENIRVLQSKVVRVPRCYPVYEIGYQEHIQKISDYLQQFQNLQLIGRYGSYKYNNQDHSIMMGLLAAQNVLHNKNIDLWGVNSDKEYHEADLIQQADDKGP